MLIINADLAQNVLLLERSRRSGMAGNENELFSSSKTTVIFGDAKDLPTEIVAVVKVLSLSYSLRKDIP